MYCNILKIRDSKILETHREWNEGASGLHSDRHYTGRLKLSNFFQLYKACLVRMCAGGGKMWQEIKEKRSIAARSQAISLLS